MMIWFYKRCGYGVLAVAILGAAIAACQSDKGRRAPHSASAIPKTIEFNQHIRPILTNKCFACHGPDKNKRQADLRLDDRESALAEREGRRVIVPGKLKKSELIRRITSSDPAYRMPPPESKKTLSESEIALLSRWIADGAEYQPHWAYIKPTRPKEPEVRDKSWSKNPIDRFILAHLEERKLKPSPEADRITLIRRLAFDLTGLPPTVDEVNEFINDTSEDGYERVVDRFLNSPHFGERMALDWLDQVRYADSNGFHSDEYRSVYPYRDYVIDSFNENKPFDLFTIEQLAGDLLPGAGTEALIASGFNRLNQVTAEGGAQPKEYRAIYNGDRVRTVGSVWLGATIGCAQCHDHKYDPFTTRDFYSMTAFFADVQEGALATASDGWAPYLTLPTPEQAKALEPLNAQIAQLEKLNNLPLENLKESQTQWEEAVNSQQQLFADGWMLCRPESFESTYRSAMERLDDFSILTYENDSPEEIFTVSYKTNRKNITGLRLEALSHPEFQGKYGRFRKAFQMTELEIEAQSNEEDQSHSVEIASVTATTGGDSILGTLDGDALTAWNPSDDVQPVAVFTFAEPLPGGPGTTVTIRIKHLGLVVRQMIGRFRVSLTTAENPEFGDSAGIPEAAFEAIVGDEKRSAELNDQIARYYRTIALELDSIRLTLAKAYERRKEMQKNFATTLITVPVSPRITRILPRGNWMDESGEIVEPVVPAFLPQIDTKGKRATRLDLAKWLVSPENPLTSRVMMNRLWKLYFGTGLSKVLDDLGVQGEVPQYGDLLDWLAVEFQESGWDMKYMIRLIVTSAAYQQSSACPEALREIDPNNRLIARQSRFRIQAEMVRDQALFVSGLLTDTVGGPSVKPYQPDGYWEHLNFPKRTYEADKGAAQYRRGLYTHWQRSFLHPSLLAFDAPSREECTAERPVSNTPLQALVLLNDPTYVEAARAFAERIMVESKGSIDDRLNWAFQQVLSRPATERELQDLKTLYSKHRREYQLDRRAAERLLHIGYHSPRSGLDPIELAAWTSAARVLLNLHESITRA